MSTDNPCDSSTDALSSVTEAARLLPIDEAAHELGVSRSTLRRMIAAGAPVARQGSRGRGARTLIDPVAVRAWQDVRSSKPDLAEGTIERALAAQIPALVAAAVSEAFQETPCKRDAASLAWLACYSWARTTDLLLDALRETVPDLPEVAAIPSPIARLRKIAQ